MYRGRIDDQYVDFGKARPEATKHDLEEVIQAALARQPIPAASRDGRESNGSLIQRKWIPPAHYAVSIVDDCDSLNVIVVVGGWNGQRTQRAGFEHPPQPGLLVQEAFSRLERSIGAAYRGLAAAGICGPHKEQRQEQADGLSDHLSPS